MQHHKLAEELPSAHITINKNKVKVYQDNTIYFENGQNFEINLNNPTTYDVLAKIWINGYLWFKSGIILNSKSNVYLDRYIDQNKFKFETEDVTSNEESNGQIKILFYKESTLKLSNINVVTLSSMSNTTSSRATTISYTDKSTPSIQTDIDFSKSFASIQQYFDDLPMNGVTYHLLSSPTKSDDPMDINEIRHYCTECGYRIRKSSWKFCPKCGNKL